MSLKLRTIESALEALRNLGCAYSVRTFDGQTFEHGDLFGAAPRAVKRGAKYGYGNIKRYWQPFLTDLRPGDCVEIPAGAFDLKDLQAGVAAGCVKNWGAGSATTMINREKQAIEVLRIR